MARFVGVIVLLAAFVAGVGFYLGWFHLSTNQTDQKAAAKVTVDEHKVTEDKERAEEKAQALERKVKEKTSSANH